MLYIDGYEYAMTRLVEEWASMYNAEVKGKSFAYNITVEETLDDVLYPAPTRGEVVYAKRQEMGKGKEKGGGKDSGGKGKEHGGKDHKGKEHGGKDHKGKEPKGKEHGGKEHGGKEHEGKEQSKQASSP